MLPLLHEKRVIELSIDIEALTETFVSLHYDISEAMLANRNNGKRTVYC
jgi:hypothetical protein